MLQCVFCKSSKNIVCAGKHHNKKGDVQRYKCNICRKRFASHDAFWKMKHNPEIIVEALSCKKRGMPYEEISKHFYEYNKAEISGVTVFNWVKKYGETFDSFNKKQIPRLSGKINADEFVFKVKKKEMLSMGKQRQKNKV